MTKTAKIIGPPGTGKTTYLIRQIGRDLARYFPKDICIVSYTNAAVNEIKGRIGLEFDMNPKAFHYAATVHSICFRLLGLDKEQVAESGKNIKAWNEQHPQYALAGAESVRSDMQDLEISQKQMNDRALADINVLRNQLIPVDKWPDHLLPLWRTWEEWMAENDLCDFTGMMERVLENELAPPISVLYADEQQDLSALGIAVLQMWSRDAEKAVFIGDENQAIYRFSGAVPEAFMSIKAEFNTVLNQSYRVPAAVLDLSKKIISRSNVFGDHEYHPTSHHGSVGICDVQDIDLSGPGTHMILSRCNYQVAEWVRWLYQHDVLFHNPYRVSEKGWNPTHTNAFKALRTYCDIIAGKEVFLSEAKIMVKEMKAKDIIPRGGKGAFAKLTGEKVDMFDFIGLKFNQQWIEGKIPTMDCFSFKSKFADKFHAWFAHDQSKFQEIPRVIVGTIHSVKGGEADHVWMDWAVSNRIIQQIHGDPVVHDDEARVAYVGVTRAKDSVRIVRTPHGFPNPFLSGV